MLIMLQILFNERLRDNQTLFGWLRKLVNTWAQPVYNLPVLPEAPVLHPLCLQRRLSTVCQWQPETPGSSAVFCQSPVQIEYSVQDFSVSSRPKNNDNVISIYSNNAYNTFVSTHFFFPQKIQAKNQTQDSWLVLIHLFVGQIAHLFATHSVFSTPRKKQTTPRFHRQVLKNEGFQKTNA